MKATKKSGSATAVMVAPDPAVKPGSPTIGPRVSVNPAAEKDYWHVNYMTRPYYKQGRSFGDYESAYRYGWENAGMPEEMTFEEAEKTHLSAGWAAARGASPLVWDEVREATRDAWTRARRNRTL